MISLAAGEAFRAYEAVRHRLPTARSPSAAPRRIGSLQEIAELFDVFLLDAFGVLNVGETAIPGVQDRIRDLRRMGKHVLVVSNAASVPGAALRQKYARMGFDFAPEDIITSRATMAAGMIRGNDLHWGVMRVPGSGCEDLGLTRMTALEDDPEAYDAVDGFLLIGSGSWTEARQEMLETALRTNPRKVLVANPDIVAPREAGFSIEPGYFAHRLADSSGIAPEFFGKPFANIYELAFQRVGDVEKERIVMVGDSLHTDILGAQSVGVASALVAGYGFFAGQDVDAAIEASGIVPNFVVARP